MALKLGEMLIKAGKITKDQLKNALQHQKDHGGKLGEVLLHLRFVEDENVINGFIAKQLNIGNIELDDLEVDMDVVNLIPVDLAKKFDILSVIKVGKILFVATNEPQNVSAFDTLKFITGCEIQPVMTSKDSVQKAIDKYYNLGESLTDIVEEMGADMEIVEETEDSVSESELQAAVQDKPIVRLVNSIILDAIKINASDIHIEVYEKRFRVRYRVDGGLREVLQLPFGLRLAVISRIKILAKLNISERRLPQDGRIKIQAFGRAIDLRGYAYFRPINTYARYVQTRIP